jgi:uncharacterized protein YqjF (DUF2071 family)
MAGAEPEEQVAVPLVRQSWRQVSFLHWRVDGDQLAHVLPDGLTPDLVDGSAWLGLTPFRVEQFRVLGVPALPFCSFLETNLRTYVRHRDGQDGIWFFSLDVSSRLNAAGGRMVAPYHLSAMSLDDGECVRYRSRRRRGPAYHDITIAPGAPIAAAGDDDPVTLLTGRWRAFSQRPGGRLLQVPVRHQPWPLQTATLVALDESILAAAGFGSPASEPLVHHSAAGVDARLGPPRPAQRADEAQSR